MVILLQLLAFISLPCRSSVQVVDPSDLDSFLSSREQVIVEFSSRMGEIYGTSALTGLVFKEFSFSSGDIVCVRCLDKTKSGVSPLPFFPPLYVSYRNGKRVGHCSGYTTSRMFKELLHGPDGRWLEAGVAIKPEPHVMGGVKAFS